MQKVLLAPAVPSNSYARPIRFSYGATVGLIVSPANAVADFEQSGLVAGHFLKSIIKSDPPWMRFIPIARIWKLILHRLNNVPDRTIW
jgi:hypothetical protein